LALSWKWSGRVVEVEQSSACGAVVVFLCAAAALVGDLGCGGVNVEEEEEELRQRGVIGVGDDW
jgi:hypothetical protein